MLLVHSEIYYVPIGDGWEEVLVRNTLQVGTLPNELSRQLILSVVCASHLTAREGSNL